MAKKNNAVVIAEGETDDETIHEGEVLTGENYEQYADRLADTIEGCEVMVEDVKAHSKEGRMKLFITATSICITCATKGHPAMFLVDKFFAALGDEGKNQYRSNSFRKFFETAGPFAWDTNRMVKTADGKKEEKKAGLVLHETKRSDFLSARNKNKAAFDSGLMKVSPWQMAGREAGYVPVDVPATLRALAKRARKNLTKDHITKTKATATDVSENNLDLLDQVEELLLRYDQAKNRAPAHVHAEPVTMQ